MWWKVFQKLVELRKRLLGGHRLKLGQSTKSLPLTPMLTLGFILGGLLGNMGVEILPHGMTAPLVQ